MALPQVGLEAVITNLPQFTAGAMAITNAYDNIEKKAGNVAKSSGNLASSISSLSSPFVNIGQSVLNFGAIAGGAALVGVTALAAGVVALGASALGEVSKFERMSLSIQNLIAREISQGQVVEQQKQVRIQLTQQETQELEKLKNGLDNEINDRDILSARIEEQKQKIFDLTAQYGDNGLVVIKERAELQGMQLDLTDLNSEISTHQGRIVELTSKEGQLTTTLEKVRVGQISMSEAMEQASPIAQDYIKWIQLLSIQSPFTSEGIQMAFQTAMAYGFTAEEAKRLTEAEVDFVAATGKTAQSADLIALALGQIQARGKLSAQELRQLSEQGIGVNKILEDMGFSLDDVTNGLVPVDQFINAVIADMEVFTGAAKIQATTFSGLISSLSEVKQVGLREFFTGTFQAIQPYLASFVDFLTKAALETGSIRKLGDVLGQYVGGALSKISEFIRVMRSGGLAVFSKYLGSEGIFLWKELKTAIGNVSRAISDFSEIAKTNLINPLTNFTDNIIPVITQGLRFVNEHFEELKGALIGIGAVLAVGVFAALTAGLLSLLTPINLIIAGAALLGAAWTGNWLGMRDTILSAWGVIQPILSEILSWGQLLVTAFQGGGMEAVGQVGLFISQKLQESWDTYIMPTLVGWGTAFMGWVSSVYPQIPTMLTALVTNIATFLRDNWPTISEPLMEWSTKIWDWVKAAAGTAAVALGALGLAILTWATSGEAQAAVGQLGQQIGIMITDAMKMNFEAGGGILSALSSLALGLLSAVGSIVPSLIILGGQIVAGILSGILSEFGVKLQPATFSELGKILTGIGTNIVTIAGYVGRQIVTGIMNGFNAMVATLTDFVKEGVDGWRKPITDTDWFGIGESIIDGILKGISENTDKVLEKLKEIAADWLQSVKDSIGWGSPATEYIPLGVSIIQGLVSGVTSESPKFANAMMKILNPRSIMAQFLVPQGQRADIANLMRSLIPEFAGQFEAGALNLGQAIQIGLNRIGSNVGVGQVIDALQRVGLSVEGVTGQIQDAFDETQKIIRLQNLAQAASTGGQLAQFGIAASERMQARIDILKAIVESGQEGNFEGQIISAAEAQEKLNFALFEQQGIQNQILDLQRQQADLQWMQQQIALIQMIKDLGLDASEILGGVTLGLDADIPNIILAMNNVVQAMLDQMDADLQISSPSKVMADKAKMAMAGFARGLVESVPGIQAAAQSVISGPMVNAPVGGGWMGNQRVTNNYFDMSVNTGASPQAVVYQYEVMRAMVG